MYLGIDLGTSGVRVILTDRARGVVAACERTYPCSHPRTGWSEQDPADWIRATGAAISDVRAQAPGDFAGLRGIGFSGQMHGAVLVDSAGQVLRPCILWNDSRAAAEAAALDADPAFRAISGNIVFPGFTAPKLVWVARHEPEVFARVATVLLPKDYLRLWLTGDMAMEMSDAAGTGWLDLCGRVWSEVLLERGGMRPDQVPPLVEGAAPAGQLRAELRAEWGLPAPVLVAAGAADNAAAACGTGCLAEGQGFVSLGTSGVLLCARDACAPAPDTAVHTFCHALPGRWYQMGVILSATDALNWLARNTGQSAGALSALTGPDLGPPSDVTFLPYLSGERTPHNDARIRAALVGLDIATDTGELTRAVMQGVAFALRDSLTALRATGARPARLLAIGGGARSDYWVKLLATVLDLPLDLPAGGELGAALGAARLAMLADTPGATAEDVITPPDIARTVPPDPALRDVYRAAYHRFRALYPALKPFAGATP